MFEVTERVYMRPFEHVSVEYLIGQFPRTKATTVLRVMQHCAASSGRPNMLTNASINMMSYLRALITIPKLGLSVWQVHLRVTPRILLLFLHLLY